MDAELFTGCASCSDRCQMDAIGYPAGVASVDLLLCIGCDLCVSTCPDEAIERPSNLSKSRSRIRDSDTSCSMQRAAM
jgi:ferredoxin